MRITRVFTVCAVLILALMGAEAIRTDRLRRARSMDHQSDTKPRNNVDISQITFTTLLPEVLSTTQKPASNLYSQANKSPLRNRQYSSPAIGGFNLFPGNRRRRQLQRISPNKYRFGRSLNVASDIDLQHIETLQKPEVFQDGAVHIEPIYRITKNTNIFDSIVSLMRRIVDPPKNQLGPLVGPFQFPGIGDKVFIRLLESTQPNHLVVRLVSHVPASEIGTPLNPSILPSAELLSNVDIPYVNHGPLELSADAFLSPSSHHSNLPLGPLDSLHSSSSNVLQIAKPGSSVDLSAKEPQISTVHKSQAASKNPGNTLENVVRHRKRNQRLALPVGKSTETARGKYRDARYLRTNEFPEVFNHAYYPDVHQSSVHSSFNDSSEEKPLLFKFHDIPSPVNTSNMVKVLPSDSIYPYKSPFSQFQLQNDSAEDQPHYSLEFVSKKMRYLNLDGSVDESGDGFKSVERSSDLSKNSGQYLAVNRSEGLRERSDYFYPDKQTKSSNSGSPSSAAFDTVRQPEKQGSRCPRCLKNKNESDRLRQGSKHVLGDHRESTVNNSTRLVTTTLKPGLEDLLQKSAIHLLDLHRQLESLKKNSTTSREV